MLVERSERSGDGPLAAGSARIVRLATGHDDRGFVVALIPAHDEDGPIEDAIRSLHEQTPPPDVILVVTDNGTDGTVRLAKAAPADVFETVDSAGKKAGP